MFCPECGNQVKDGAVFCSNCGTPMESPTNVAQIPLASNNTADAFMNDSVAAAPPKRTRSSVKNSKKLVAILIPVAVILCLLITVGSVVAVKMNSPLVKIGNAFTDLLSSGDTNTYNISYEDAEDEFSASGNLKIDLKGKNIDLRNFRASIIDESIYKGEISDSEKHEIRNGEAFLHVFSKEVGFRADVSGSYQYYAYDIDEHGEYRTSFYNGYYIGYDHEGEFTGATNVFGDFAENDEELFLDKGFELVSLIFDVLNGDRRIDEAQRQVIELAIEMFPDFEDEIPLLSDTQFQLNDKVVKQVTQEAKKCFTNTQWLEQNFGLVVSKQNGVTTYIFNVDLNTASRALYDIFEPLLKDIYDQAVQLEEYSDLPDYEDIVDEFLSEDGEIYSIDVKLEIQLKGSKLSAINIKVKAEFDTVKIHMDVSKAADISSVDSKPYTKDISKAKQYIKDEEERWRKASAAYYT